MPNTLSKIYSQHHKSRKKSGFSIMEEDRGRLLSGLIGEGKKILDLGCRDGTLTKYFAGNNQILGVDVDEDSINKAKTNLNIEIMQLDLNGDWAELQGRSFDVVVAGEILEHLYFPEEITKKVAARLGSSGMFIGSVPNAFSFKNRLRYFLGRKKNTPLEDPTHINHFSAKELESMLNKYFDRVSIMGLGRHKILARIFPSHFAFDLFFVGILED